jgi:hypothetical protein
LILLPGAFFAAAISDFIKWILHRENSLVFYGLLVGFNFVWYFLICFTGIKIYRFVSRYRKTSRLVE